MSGGGGGEIGRGDHLYLCSGLRVRFWRQGVEDGQAVKALS
jgi:hypothetical protein